ncbi:response regulator transcription factor [Peptoniphilus indolicus]|uniref:Phosphate regulon transcriptional regulatory protein phoB n=1 Tax=Peptoniphilus indolicus TaxID=33030 RepID=A0A379DD43_9FIRM|nr:response regulator transcription factor [Peptoniphilus indolicus]SUB75511.1 Phosphate regulon transcriptional regulatory protein phoB [Peptoniphilus indolicus]
MKKILIIGDDKNLNKGLSIALKKNYKLISTFTISESKNYIGFSDLILLDMNLPDGDGLETIKYTRQISTIPIIILSAVNLESYIISAIDLGADDYLTKPFSPGILEAKIKRTFEKINSDDLSIYEKNGLNFNFNENKFMVNNKNIDLTRTEIKILYYFIKNKAQVLTKELLFDFVWGIDNEFIDQNTLSVNISRIRNNTNIR